MTSATATVAPSDLERLRDRVTATRRWVVVVRVAAHILAFVAAVAIIGLPGRFIDDPRPERAVVEVVVFGLLPALFAGLVEGLAMHLRTPLVSTYLARLAQRSPDGLALDAKDRELTTLGRRVLWVSASSVVLVVLAVVLGRAELGWGVLAGIGTVVVGALFVFDAEERSYRLTRPGFLSFEATAKGLVWHRAGGERIALGWYQIRRIARRNGVLRTSVSIDSLSGSPRRSCPPRYRDPETGEVVELFRVVPAVRPGAFRTRRRLRLLALETTLEPVGMAGG